MHYKNLLSMGLSLIEMVDYLILLWWKPPTLKQFKITITNWLSQNKVTSKSENDWNKSEW